MRGSRETRAETGQEMTVFYTSCWAVIEEAFVPAKQNWFSVKATIDSGSTTAAVALHRSRMPANRPTSSHLLSPCSCLWAEFSSSQKREGLLSLGGVNQSCSFKFRKKEHKQLRWFSRRSWFGSFAWLCLFPVLQGWTSVAVSDGFCRGCVWQGAIPHFPCGSALSPFLSRPRDNRE